MSCFPTHQITASDSFTHTTTILSDSGNLMFGEVSEEISTWSTTKAPEITETGATTGTEPLLTEDWSATDEGESSESGEKRYN